MKNRWGMTEEEKAAEVRKRMLRASVLVYNACMTTIKERECKFCPFSVSMGCILYGHPCEWQDKIKEAKAKR
jgi:hypothetical protein